MDDLSSYDYELPEELIAKIPLERRDASRLLVVDRRTGEISHHLVRELSEFLRAGDCLVMNDTKVVPARIFGHRAKTGGKWEGLFLGTTGPGIWRLIGQTRGTLATGEEIVVTPAHADDASLELRLKLIHCEPDGVWHAAVDSTTETFELLNRIGTVPLPPYIRRRLARREDWARYQTTYARTPGSIAAPTAGLHLTAELLAECRQRGVTNTFLTLHVGLGTFRPIAAATLDDHQMHAEWCEIPPETSAAVNAARSNGGRVVAVGTTSVRTLESAAGTSGLRPWTGETQLFIRPPYQFRAINCLLTNFHLPRSTLLVLVSAFAGVELVQRAYAAAIAARYRFYSYGDAMLIL